jgi:Cys-tRNA(Pro)/Cys-tRNA(Cys) deacylase
MKTNGARFLETLGIPFELLEYEVDPEDLSAITVAKKIGMPPEQVFKTLLTSGGHGDYVFAVIPGDAELDFKKLARATGLRKSEMAPLKDVQPLTGYIRGGVTIFGAKKAYPVFVDETAILFDKVSVSAGTRGTQLMLTPDNYLRAARSLRVPVETADLTKDARPTAGATEAHA